MPVLREERHKREHSLERWLSKCVCVCDACEMVTIIKTESERASEQERARVTQRKHERRMT